MLRAAVVLLSVVTLAPVAAAHTLMTSPTPRSDSDGLKTGPCGNVAPTGAPQMFTAGETITVQWLETIDHPGYYRIAFSPPGDASFEDNILLDEIADVACGAPPCNYSAQVTLPSEPCEGCALQLIQFMGNAPPYSPYFSCADVTLMAAPAPDAGVPVPGEPDAGVPEVPADDDAGIGDTAPQAAELSGGCRAAGSAGGSVVWPLLAVIAFGLRRRRHRRRSSRC